MSTPTTSPFAAPPAIPANLDDAFDEPGDDAPSAAADAGGKSPLDLLREEVASEHAIPTINLEVPTRDGWAVRFRTDLEQEQLKAFNRRAETKKRNPITGEKEVDELKLSRMILGTYSVAVLRDGVVVETEDGDALTLAHPEFLAMVGATTVSEAVQRWYVTDGGVIQVGRAFMSATGWLDAAQEADDEQASGPTARP